MKKLLSLFMTVALLVTMLAGCSFTMDLPQITKPDSSLQTEEPTAPETTEPHVTDNEVLVYSLDQAMVDDFYRLLEEAEDAALNAPTWEEADAKTTEVDDAYMLLLNQNQIAYVLYCIDQSNDTLSQRYLDSTDIVTQAELDYNDMIRRVYLSDTPYKEQLFEGWTQADIDRMLRHNEQIAKLEKRNAEITLEYRELDPITQAAEMIPLYNELVSNNNTMATIYGYDNYYTFAYEVVYARDYNVQQLQQMRDLVAKYLPDLYINAMNQFYSNMENLTDDEIMQLNQILFDDYNTLPENLVDMYLADLPESMQQGMGHMFDNERVVFTNSENSYEGAFTTYIYDEPFCYFGPGYQNSETLIHELGHYYAGLYSDGWGTPMDICETQSQGNEWLLTHYLRNQISPQMYDVIVDYKLLNNIGNIIVFVMIDEFEEMVYAHENAGNLTLEQYDALMEEIGKKYGGISFISEYIGDVQGYWKMVVLEQPVYYISYAVSAVAAVNLYTIAREDEAAARECYRKLIEELVPDNGFLWNIQQAGLAGPFEETVYKQLAERYGTSNLP